MEILTVLSLKVWTCGLGVVLRRRRHLSFSVYEIAEEWELVGKYDQLVPTEKGAPCNDCKLYDLILLLGQIELHFVYLFDSAKTNLRQVLVQDCSLE